MVEQLGDTGLEGLEAGLVERLIDAVVDAVAGEDHLRLHFLQGAAQAFEQARPGEFASGMTGLAETGERLAGKTQRIDLETQLRAGLLQEVVHERDVGAALGDAITEHDDTFAREGFGGLGASEDRGGEQTDEQAEGSHGVRRTQS